MIYRLLLCGLLCTAAFGLTSAGVLSDQVLALVYNRRTTFWTTVLDRLFARTRLLLATGGGTHVIPLESTQLTIGRGNQNDIAIATDEYASARHARFEPRQDGVWVQDLGSTNGTYLNGARLEHPRLLSPGDVIRVGETDLRFEA